MLYDPRIDWIRSCHIRIDSAGCSDSGPHKLAQTATKLLSQIELEISEFLILFKPFFHFTLIARVLGVLVVLLGGHRTT